MEEKKYRLTRNHIMYIVATIAVLCLVSIFVVNNNSGQPPVETPPATTEHETVAIKSTETESIAETLSEEERNQIIRDTIDKTVSDWVAGTISFEEASSLLTKIIEANNSDLANYAQEQLTYLSLENSGNTSLELAQKFLGVKNYVQVLSKLNEIDPTYSKYDSVLEAYKTCEEQVLQAVESPNSEEQFESYIKLLEECNNLYEAQSFTDRKNQLSDELIVFRDVSETIDAATVQFDSQNVQEAFVLLVLGIEKYPTDERLATTLVNYRDHYVISITKQAVELCQQKEYKEALQIVEAAIEEYDCNEFQLLREAIKEEKSFLYRLKNDIVDTFTSVTDGWKTEEFDVKQAANDAGAYVVKSGKKLALGDYTDENVTLLSFSGNMAASLLGADLLFDLRDLSYDITHWGEEKYFAVWLAADVVALLPVIGVVKYFSHFKTAKNGLEAASELVDSAADISKNAENASELVNTISDVTKVGDDIIDTVGDASDVKRSGLVDNVKETLAHILKGHTLVPTTNQKLLGKTHSETGVKFVLSKIQLSDGRKIKGVFPRFDSFVDIELPKELYKASFYEQQKECMEQLQKQLKNPFSRLRDKFTEGQIADIMKGDLPEGFTWHHNEQEGLMQLVDTLIHDQTGHTGGMKIWGIGHK